MMFDSKIPGIFFNIYMNIIKGVWRNYEVISGK